jgi:hypothetical protein
MSPQRDEEMFGTREFGLPSQHCLALEMDRNASPTRHSQGATKKP